MDRDKVKQLMTLIVTNFKNLEIEILALRTAMHAIQMKANIEGDPEILVKLARNAPNVQQLINAKYDPPLARFLEQLDEGAETDEKFLEYLRSWKPSGSTN
jgi:hypothetical protein